MILTLNWWNWRTRSEGWTFIIFLKLNNYFALLEFSTKLFYPYFLVFEFRFFVCTLSVDSPLWRSNTVRACTSRIFTFSTLKMVFTFVLRWVFALLLLSIEIVRVGYSTRICRGCNSRFILCRMPRAACRTELNIRGYQLSLHFHKWRNGIPSNFTTCKYYERDSEYAHMKTMQPACCGPAESRDSRPHGFSCVHTRDRDRTQHASEIAGNFTVQLVKMQRKVIYVQLGAACGTRHAAKYEPAFRRSLESWWHQPIFSVWITLITSHSGEYLCGWPSDTAYIYMHILVRVHEGYVNLLGTLRVRS